MPGICLHSPPPISNAQIVIQIGKIKHTIVVHYILRVGKILQN